MGSSGSKKAYGNMQIEGVKAEYYAGTLVTGVLSINLLADLPSNQLTIELKGFEVVNFVKLTQAQDNAKVDTSSPNIIKRKELHSDIMTMSPNSKKFLKGSYHFPFSFKLPNNLPSTFSTKFRKHQDMCYGGIDYNITAVAGKGPKTVSIERQIKIKELYTPNNVMQNSVVVKNVNLHEFRVSLNKLTTILKDSLKATVFFDNTSSNDKIKNFEWKTEMKIILKAGGKINTCLMEVDRGTLEGVTANQRFDKSFLIGLNMHSDNFKDIITFKGNLIDISYVLKVYAVSPVMQVFTKKTKIKYFIKILNYKPDQYVETESSEASRGVIVRTPDIISNIQTNNNSNMNKPRERVTLPAHNRAVNTIEENRRFTALPPIQNNRGFNYPEINSVLHGKNNQPDVRDIKIYTVPLNKELLSYKELDEYEHWESN